MPPICRRLGYFAESVAPAAGAAAASVEAPGASAVAVPASFAAAAAAAGATSPCSILTAIAGAPAASALAAPVSVLAVPASAGAAWAESGAGEGVVGPWPTAAMAAARSMPSVWKARLICASQSAGSVRTRRSMRARAATSDASPRTAGLGTVLSRTFILNSVCCFFRACTSTSRSAMSFSLLSRDRAALSRFASLRFASRSSLSQGRPLARSALARLCTPPRFCGCDSSLGTLPPLPPPPLPPPVLVPDTEGRGISGKPSPLLGALPASSAEERLVDDVGRPYPLRATRAAAAAAAAAAWAACCAACWAACCADRPSSRAGSMATCRPLPFIITVGGGGMALRESERPNDGML
mmetsp:Transcript_12649/g.38104  ORF Transcript_12649/g.38104 Transcript_12649/m.38104 type:complete len:354 (+) Transcript_12649:3636-4697(+)